MKRALFSGLLLIMVTASIFYQPVIPKVEESIKFFPIAPGVTFRMADTSLKTNGAALQWKVESALDRKAYLRQDASLLYRNGRLADKMSEWQQNTGSLKQEKLIPIKGSSFFEAITFHHAELHPKGEQIFSSQASSSDYLYAIRQKPDHLLSFRSAGSKEQREWKQQLDEITQRTLQYSWNKAIRHFAVRMSEYQSYPLNLFNNLVNAGLPGFSKDASDRMMGNLWQGLYENYLLELKKADGTSVSPIGSTMPLILLSNDHSHLLVLTEAADGTPILLRQMIEAGD